MLLNELAPVLTGAARAAARAAASPAVRSIVADGASKKFKQTMASKYAPTPATAGTGTIAGIPNVGTMRPTTMHNYVGPSQDQARHHPRTVTNITNNQEPELTPERNAAKEAEEKKKKEELGTRLVNKTVSSIPSATGKFAKWLSDSAQMQLSTP